MLINRTKVKEFALEMAKHRAHKFTRVGGQFFVKCEGILKEFIRKSVHTYIPRENTGVSSFGALN